MRRLPANSKWVEAQTEIFSWPMHVPFEIKENNTVEFLCELGSKDCYVNQTREQRFLFEHARLLKRIAPATKGESSSRQNGDAQAAAPEGPHGVTAVGRLH